MKSSHPTKHPYLKYLCLGSILLFSFLQGLMNVYIGGTEALLQSMFHLRAPAFTELTATLMFSNGVGCIVFGTLILIILHRVVKHYPTVIKINATK